VANSSDHSASGSHCVETMLKSFNWTCYDKCTSESELGRSRAVSSV